jgi:hypothetical protein
MRLADVFRIKIISRIAELAGYLKTAVRRSQVIKIFGLELRQEHLHAFTRAPAMDFDPLGLEHANVLFMKQPEQQPLGGKLRIDQFVIFCRRATPTDAAPSARPRATASRRCLLA